MKNFVFIIGASLSYLNTIAQTISYTNAPVVGDLNSWRFCDSVGVIPKNTGTGSLWDFSLCTPNTSSLTLTYINASSHSAYSSFAGSNIAEIPNNGNYSVNFLKSSSSKNEWYGQYDQFSINYDVYLTNPLALNIWPMNFGTSNTDIGSGTIKEYTTSVAATATAVISGSGTGTIVLPGGTVYTNILQTKLTQTVTGSFSNKTVYLVKTTYSYYHSSLKFPLLSLIYSDVIEVLVPNGGAQSSSRRIQVNSAALAGINEFTFETDLILYPNPTTDHIQICLSNKNNSIGSIEIYNELGQISDRVELGNDATIKTSISVADLKPGVYFVKTILGERTTTKKLIVQ